MADTPRTRLATRLSFFVAGLGVASWAPLVPYAKDRVGADEAMLGMLLLCLGIGSVVSMPLSGGLCGRMGSRFVILLGGLGVAAALPVLATAGSVPLLAAGLFLFGASIGAVDVAVNIHGTTVQEAAGVPLMSNFHGMYSVGGLAGSAGMTALLSFGALPSAAVWIPTLVVLLCLVLSAPRLLKTKAAGDTPFFVRPRGVVIVIGVLAGSMFLVEGAMLDWSAVLLESSRGIATEKAGIGFVLFSLAMTVGRLTGDAVTHVLGGRRILFFGALLAASGIALVVFAPWNPLVLAGFVIIGLGAANMVPVLFTAAGRQKIMSPDLAIAAVSALGYLGVLIGPAAIGFIAKSITLSGAFLVLGVLTLLVGSMSRVVSRD